MAHAYSYSKDGNSKTRVPTTTTSNDSCPPSCGFMNNGCYAEGGPLGMLWRKLSITTPGDTFENGKAKIQTYDLDGLLRKIKSIPRGMLWRHNQAGDLPGIGANIDAESLAEIVKANRGKRGWTYTHKPYLGKNKAAIDAANRDGFTINVSANSAEHAAKLKAANPDLPVVCVLPIEAENQRVINQDGVKILVCPATRPGSTLTCAACGLCQIATRRSVVGFPAHGASKKKAAAIAAA